MINAEFAKSLIQDIELVHAPIALSFLNEPPDGVSHVGEIVPSACTFWRRAEERLFYTTAEDHFECPVGTLTMGFDLPEEKKTEAEKLFGEMLRLQYLSTEEFPKIPKVEKPHKVVLYGPLARFPGRPDVVLMIGRPGQAMILSEALGSASWIGPALTMLGRPTCGVIPHSMGLDQAATSAACVGARIYAELGEDELVMVFPGSQMEEVNRKIKKVLEANKVLQGFHIEKKQRLSLHQEP